MGKKETEGFERVFNIVGGHGVFQVMLLGILSLQSMFLVFHHIGSIFLAAVPDHWCDVEIPSSIYWSKDELRNISIPVEIINGVSKPSSCQYYDIDYERLGNEYEFFEDAFKSINFTSEVKKSCSKWLFDDSIYTSTVVTQFELVCERSHLAPTIQSSYMGGVLIGSLVLGSLSDKFLGRRRAILIAICLIISGGFFASFATSFGVFVFFRFLIAVGVAGSFQNCYVLLLEHADSSYRALLGIIYQISFAAGYMIMPIYGYMLRDWSDLQFAFAFTTLTLLSYIWILPESARWLGTKGREDESIARLLIVAKWNKKKVENEEPLREIVKEVKIAKEETEEKETNMLMTFWINLKIVAANYRNLVKTPQLRRRSLVIWTLFTSVAFVYYGVVFDSPNLTSNPFVLVFLSGLMEVPAYTFIVPFVSRWGRRPSLITTFLATGIGFFLLALTPFEYGNWRIFLSMFGKMCISSAFGIVYLLGAELFPTSYRTTGLGCAVLMGRIGSMLAPHIAHGMRNIYQDLPSVIFGVVSISAGIFGLLLPETKDEEMFDKVDELEKKGQKEGKHLTLQFKRKGKDLGEVSIITQS